MEDTSWHKYPSPKTIGHAMVRELLLDPVIVEEKIDGSQFSFGVIDGEFKCRSKGAILNLFAPEKMFIQAVESAKARLDSLKEGWTYRCEYLQRPKHNVLAYDRIPRDHLIIIDINDGNESYLSYEDKKREAQRLELETTPLLYSGIIEDPTILRDYLDMPSILGGKMEGVVVKNYKRFSADGKVQMGKFVSKEFKEIHSTSWKESNPEAKDIIQILINKYRTPARWQKAVQHLKELGKIKSETSDLQFLFKEVSEDVQRECEAEIKEQLFNWSWSKINRGITGGLAEWYKEQLMKNSFNTKES